MRPATSAERPLGGMSREIGVGHTGAAIDILPDWTAHSVAEALQERDPR